MESDRNFSKYIEQVCFEDQDIVLMILFIETIKIMFITWKERTAIWRKRVFFVKL